MRLVLWDVELWSHIRAGRQITNLFLVLMIKLKLLLQIDSSGCALPLSPIKGGKMGDYRRPLGPF